MKIVSREWYRSNTRSCPLHRYQHLSVRHRETGVATRVGDTRVFGKCPNAGGDGWLSKSCKTVTILTWKRLLKTSMVNTGGFNVLLSTIQKSRKSQAIPCSVTWSPTKVTCFWGAGWGSYTFPFFCFPGLGNGSEACKGLLTSVLMVERAKMYFMKRTVYLW